MATWQDNPGLLQSGQPLFGSGTSGLLGYTPKSIPHYVGPRSLPAFGASTATTSSTTSPTGSLAMPDVEGYKYAYIPWQWNQDNNRYEQLAFNVWDQTQYPYFPYMPTGGQVVRDGNRADRILVGFRLVPEGTEGDSSISGTTTTTTGTGTTSSGGNPYANYVNKYGDLAAAWADIQAGREPHSSYWRERGATSIDAFGKAHWDESGRNEGRTL